MALAISPKLKSTDWASRTGQWYLVYLALMPAVGTFALFAIHKAPVNPVLFLLLGTAAVGIYLAVTAAHTVISSSAWRNCAMLLDGPAWMIFGLLAGGMPAAAVTNIVFIEIAAVLLGVLGVVTTSHVPTPTERRKAWIAVSLPLVGVIAAFIVYVGTQSFTWQQLVLILAAVLQAAVWQFRLGSKNAVQRDATQLILIGIIAWAFTFVAVIPIWLLLVTE